ncbi:hypothetical protein ACJZ2D_016653 [Fusarium nematophilum]
MSLDIFCQLPVETVVLPHENEQEGALVRVSRSPLSHTQTVRYAMRKLLIHYGVHLGASESHTGRVENAVGSAIDAGATGVAGDIASASEAGSDWCWSFDVSWFAPDLAGRRG